MYITGIICEYNPFHNGHAWQIAEIRRRNPDTAIVALLSGAFCQRGSAALLDKWTRARLAVTQGCDLVLELPFVFACRSAQAFATGGVQLLASLGLEGQLAFGAETDDLATLQQAAAHLASPALQTALRARLAQGAAYAAALADSLQVATGLAPALLRQPNNILALEYLRALQTQPCLAPLLLPRHSANHHDCALHQHYASGTAIRQALYCATAEPDWPALASAVPPATLTALQNAVTTGLPDANRLLPALQTALLSQSSAALYRIYGLSAGEGILPRLRSAATAAVSLDDFIHRAATRHYTAARLRRLVPYLLLGLTTETIQTLTANGPAYVHVLAINTRGQAVLHAAKQSAAIPIVTRFSQLLTSQQRDLGLAQLTAATPQLTQARQQAALDSLATELRNLTLPPASHQQNDFNTSPYVTK